MSKQILGIQRVFENRDKGVKWNNKKIRWTIVQNQNNITKNYDVELEMVLISSKRIVKVNGQQKDIQMCSFGYQSKFLIDEDLQGFIKQDGLSFQLYVNGISFTKLETNKNVYQPPKLTFSTNQSIQLPKKQKQQSIEILDMKNKTKKSGFQSNSNSLSFLQLVQKNKNIQKQTEQMTFNKKSQTNLQQENKISLKLTHKPKSQIIGQNKKETLNLIKSTQDDLMKILIQEKKKKKELSLLNSKK